MVDIKVKNVYKKYDGNDKYSVDNFNIDIHDKEFVVFVGPSGSGKSTALRMIAGLEEITDGELYIDGKLMNDVPAKDRGIAMVFQNYALYPHMNVYDNLAFGLKLRKYNKNEIDKRVRESANLLGLTEFIDRKPANLSGGQRQRVALGRAIVRDANVFLMDEPLSNLDAKLRVQMRAEISKLHQRLETTTIYVTHDQTEAMTMADRIVIMDHGVVQQIGTPIEVYDHPANKFVAGFIGSPAMNFFNLLYKDGYVTNNENITLKVTEPQRKLLEKKGYQNKNITFGIRPEDIHSEQIIIESSLESVIEAKVTVSELLGSETMLYLERDSNEFIAKVDSRDHSSPGNNVTIAVNMNKARYFDPETGENLQPITRMKNATLTK
ncbi:sn-glycerol-3-phosphate ABC transporter ATP-binding protein UgpC [Aerococcaceae bacterium INB8]|uniref:sn-glycerol-3-phosphate ABC transporter ATP-binding protein UgpC n=1 Tax=Ruoffia halotolerans TaxID=2748684 RepID=A0A839A3S0_9LACT|nr:sn-glycerol-3-phosphate ABC transporter ATP-binding protein UgpC [Ruoffia halotolerans]MBA5728438.1 sn-glycerol-3-phosphate ABC transporter ATP-binding protein UgpC [Ruoffia halotolerans]